MIEKGYGKDYNGTGKRIIKYISIKDWNIFLKRMGSSISCGIDSISSVLIRRRATLVIIPQHELIRIKISQTVRNVVLFFSGMTRLHLNGI